MAVICCNNIAHFVPTLFSEIFTRKQPDHISLSPTQFYLKESPAEAGLEARRATQPIGTPAAIIEKIKSLQQTISMEKVVIHMMYGGMPKEKAEKSLRLFAEKVLPEVQAMPTPINPRSLG